MCAWVTWTATSPTRHAPHSDGAAHSAGEAEVEAEWTAHLGEEAAAQLRAALERPREVTDPYR